MILRRLLPILFILGFAQHAIAQEDDVPVDAGKHARNTWHAVADENGGGVFFVAWAERSGEGSRIRGVFIASGQRSDFTFIDISETSEDFDDVKPSAAFLNSDTLIIAWQRTRAGRPTLLFRLIDRESGPVTDEAPLSDSDNDGMLPAIRRIDGGAVAVWQDFRNGNFDIYARRIDARGEPDEPALKLNDDVNSALQGQPRLSSENLREAVVVWSDNRVDSKWKFYFQRWKDGPVGSNMLLDSAQRKAMTTLASAAWMSPDTAVLVWKDYREGHSNIYRRIADVGRGTLTPAQRINDDAGDRWQRLPVIGGDGRGNMVMCWEDYRNTERNQRGDTYMQVFARDGSLLGPNQRVNDRDDRIARKAPVITMADDGCYLVLWHQGDEGEFNLEGQWFRYPDERLGENFCLTCREEKE